VVITAVVLSGFWSSGNALWGQKRTSAANKRLASVDGKAITEDQARAAGAAELDALELQMLRSKATFARNEHRILENALSQLIEEKLLQAEASKRGLTREQLLAKELEQAVQDPTIAEIDAFYESNRQRINKSKEEMTPQIIGYLKKQKEAGARQAFLKRLEKEHQVVRSFPPLRFDVGDAGRPALGPRSAPVTLILFSDFQCPYCKTSSETLKEITKRYGGKVRLVFRQFPLPSIHRFAQKAAEASLCAADQGRFWEMHDLLFQTQDRLKEDDLKEKANKLGLDKAAFDSCLDSSRRRDRVREDIRAGASAGMEGTPALFINGRFLSGSRPFDEIAAIIDEELKTKK
jgi:predicted DsbA family dithiol-disulfide isomerase